MRHVLWAPLIAALWASTPARAQTSDEDLARAHFESGGSYFEQGRYDDSAREFLESYRLSRRPELLINASRAQERGLRFDDAIATLERLLADHPTYDQREAMRERIRSLHALRERMEHGADREPAEPAVVGDVPPPATRSDGGGVSIPGIVVLATGGALGLGAILTGVVSQSIYDDLSATCGGAACPTDRQGDVDTGEALAITSTVLLFTGVAAIGVGIVLLIVDSGGSGDQATLELVPGPGEAGLALRGSF